jgi:hypothetical protein
MDKTEEKQQAHAESQEEFPYEKDLRFVEFIKQRVEASRDRSRLIDGHEATMQICRKLGLRVYDQL